ncbi:MAG: hypothetical protein M3N14_05515 [Bacteroidota bacterium]|nr:hypothetical protein [Bacteroidota bacterium]
MKNSIILLALSLLCNFQAYNQKSQINNETIYENLVNQSGFHKNIPIYYKTSLEVFKRVDFKKMDLTKWTVITKTDKDFKPFLDGIKLNSIQERDLTNQIGIHPFTCKGYEYVDKRPQELLILSPVIYSADKTMAACSIAYWGGIENAEKTIYLLEFKNGTWRIVKLLQVSIS